MLQKLDGTWYVDVEAGKKYLRVSRALEVIHKPALTHWAAKVEREYVVKEAGLMHAFFPSARFTTAAYRERLTSRLSRRKAFQQVSEDALDIGSQAHAMIEWVLRTELGIESKKPELNEGAAIAFGAWEEWRARTHLRPLFIEQTVWSDDHEYAGTADLIAEVDLGNGPTVAVIDWKTAKGFYLEMRLQNAAYVKAYCEMGHATYPLPGLLVRLPKSIDKPLLETLVVPAVEQENLYQGFNMALKLAKFLQATK